MYIHIIIRISTQHKKLTKQKQKSTHTFPNSSIVRVLKSSDLQKTEKKKLTVNFFLMKRKAERERKRRERERRKTNLRERVRPPKGLKDTEDRDRF